MSLWRTSVALRRTSASMRNFSFRSLATRSGLSSSSQQQTQEDQPKAGNTTTDEASTVNNETKPEATPERIADLEQEVLTWKDRCLRALADMENVRVIAKRDVETANQFGISSFARAMLDVADNLDRALENVPQTDASQNGQALAGFVNGIRGTEAEMQKVLRRHGVEKYGKEGDGFDPHKYQALFEIPSESAGDDGVVKVVTKVGYMLKERVLRPAEVGVGVHKSRDQPNS